MPDERTPDVGNEVVTPDDTADGTVGTTGGTVDPAGGAPHDAAGEETTGGTVDPAGGAPHDAAGEETSGGGLDEAAEAAGGAPGDAEVVDELPEDLDAAGFVGPYLFPNNNRRRVPGYLYLAVAAVCVAVWALVDDSSYVNDGFLLAAGLLAVVGAYQLVSGWNLDVDEQDALVAASRAVGFPVGHASAQMGWRGLLSRPTWRILLYSDENPPARRGLVLVDGVDGTIVQHFVEDNPEDWSELDAG